VSDHKTSGPGIGRWAALSALAVTCAAQVGCHSICNTQFAVPAYRLPAEQRCARPGRTEPIDLALLGQPQPESYLLGPADILSVYVFGVLPPDPDQTPVIMYQASTAFNYYPPYGALRAPTLGVPIEVEQDGNLPLPLIDPIPVAGMTTTEAREAIQAAYVQAGVLQKGRDRVTVSVIRPRVERVLVIRGDTPAGSQPQQITKGAVPYTRRGDAQVLDLPAFQNDVLHALTASGGLPGLEAEDEVWIFRSAPGVPCLLDQASEAINGGGDVDSVLDPLKAQRTVVRIPLRCCEGGPMPFAPEDVILRDGDVVYIPRRMEWFYTGGLLAGGQIPLPKDRDIDVVEAITLAGGSVGGQLGSSGPAGFRVGAGLGNVVPPTRVLILRKLPDGGQLPIRVDLARAVRDPKERVVIRPDDAVFLYYKPTELVENQLLTVFNFTFVLSPANFQ
jgi:protein involved in polysaccharide export with SLBB domain